MNKILYIKGDLLKNHEQVIMHGCNIKGGFGSGVAGAIRKMYPKCYDTYRTAFEAGMLSLGGIIVHEEPTCTILNAITQPAYGYDGKQYVDYEAIKAAMILADEMTTTGRIALPKIGAGLGGGNWEIISNIIETCVINNQPVVYTID